MHWGELGSVARAIAPSPDMDSVTDSPAESSLMIWDSAFSGSAASRPRFLSFMKHTTAEVSLLVVAALILQPVVHGQTFRQRPVDYSEGASGWPPFLGIFDAPEVPEISLSNSGRLDALLHDATA